jgi:hypothetical protein
MTRPDLASLVPAGVDAHAVMHGAAGLDAIMRPQNACASAFSTKLKRREWAPAPADLYDLPDRPHDVAQRVGTTAAKHGTLRVPGANSVCGTE